MRQPKSWAWRFITSKSGARYPEPLDRVLREMAGDYDIDRYSLETYVVGQFVLQLAPQTATPAERVAIERICNRIAWTHPAVPTLAIEFQIPLVPTDVPPKKEESRREK